MTPRPNEWTQMQQFLEDFQESFQDNMRRTMAEAIQTGVQDGVQAAFTANAANAANTPQQRNLRNNNPVFDEHEEDCDEENPFGDNNQHNQIRGRQNRNGDDPRWFSGIKIDIPKFHEDHKQKSYWTGLSWSTNSLSSKTCRNRKEYRLSLLIFVVTPPHGGVK